MALRLALVATGLAVAGCGSGGKERKLLAGVEASMQQEKLVEVDLGAYVVPVPMTLEGVTGRFEPDNLMQIELDLFAVVSPADLKKVKQLKKRNEGRLHDSVIRVCRSTSRDDLLEGQKATLKAHLLDAVQPHLGGDAVRRVGLRRVTLEEI